MFSKLAFRNVRRSFRDYGVYLLTLTFGVCLFYTFNSLDGQGAMIYLAQSQNPMAQVIQSCIDIFSVFVAVVLACLILYANSFLLRRRKRELGTYLLLGLSQGQVSRLLFLETGLIGLASLVWAWGWACWPPRGCPPSPCPCSPCGWTPSAWPSPLALWCGRRCTSALSSCW